MTGDSALKCFAYPHAEGVTFLASCDVGAKVHVVVPAQFEANATASGRENIVVAKLADRGRDLTESAENHHAEAPH